MKIQQGRQAVYRQIFGERHTSSVFKRCATDASANHTWISTCKHAYVISIPSVAHTHPGECTSHTHTHTHTHTRHTDSHVQTPKSVVSHFVHQNHTCVQTHTHKHSRKGARLSYCSHLRGLLSNSTYPQIVYRACNIVHLKGEVRQRQMTQSLRMERWKRIKEERWSVPSQASGQ